MCIDFTVSEQNNKERKDKWVEKKKIKVNPETGEIDLKYIDDTTSQDFYLASYPDKPKEIIQLDWDYKGYKAKYPFAEQHDWNQTLITRINQIAATIRKEYPIGKGASNITINPTMLPLFQDLMYFTESNGIYSLSGRYSINLDVNVPENEIIVLSELLKGKIEVLNYNKKTWIDKIKNLFSFKKN